MIVNNLEKKKSTTTAITVTNKQNKTKQNDQTNVTKKKK